MISFQKKQSSLSTHVNQLLFINRVKYLLKLNCTELDWKWMCIEIEILTHSAKLTDWLTNFYDFVSPSQIKKTTKSVCVHFIYTLNRLIPLLLFQFYRCGWPCRYVHISIINTRVLFSIKNLVIQTTKQKSERKSSHTHIVNNNVSERVVCASVIFHVFYREYMHSHIYLTICNG